MKYFWFVSISLLLSTSCSNFICLNSQPEFTAKKSAVPGFFDKENVIKFKSKISFKTSEISGILILKKINDNTLAGGFLNEFGINGFDFTITDNMMNLGYVVKNLDKWYIRRKLQTDLHFLFSRPILTAACSINDTSVYVATIEHSLHYVYYFDNNNMFERADMYKGARKISNLQQFTNDLDEIVIKMGSVNGSLSYEFCEINY